MKMPIRRRSKKGWTEAETRRGQGAFWLVILILLALAPGVDAREKERKGAKGQPETSTTSRANDANDPNELWWRKWDVPVKDPNDPNELLEVKWNAILKVLQAQDLDQPVKEKIIDRIVSPIFDFPLMAQLALGRTHWPKLNAAQRERFTTLFVERLKTLYLEKTTLYRNEKAVFKPGVVRKNTVQIPMVLVSEGQEIAMLYKLHKVQGQSKDRSNARWRIYDVEIQGVSILMTYRSQFDDILRQGTVKDLLSQLEKPPGE
jgi:phospholipid transport system substrate-binding protein